MRQKLTAVSIERLPYASSGSQKYWDLVVPGFGVRVSQRTKSFFLVMGRNRKLQTLGKFPTMSLAEARNEAKKRQISGQNASLVPRIFSDARDEYLLECEKKNRISTVKSYQGFLGTIDDKRLDAIKASDVRDESHHIMAAKVFFNWCLKKGYLEKNPLAHTKVSYNERKRILTNGEIKKIWAYEFPPYSDYLKILLLTGQRRGQFKEYEVRDGELFFPASSMKQRMDKAEDHVVPLLPMAKTFVEKLKPYAGWSKAKNRIDLHVPLPHWTVHDLRRTHSTIQASIGTRIEVTEAIIAHKSGTVSGVARIYNRYNYLKEAREALANYEAHLQTILAQSIT